MLASLSDRQRRAREQARSYSQGALYDAGLHVKTTGDAIIFAPALVTSRVDLDAMFAVLKDTLGREQL